MTLEEAKKRIVELDSGSGFFGRDYEAGWEDALRKATEILDEIDTEPELSRNPGRLTLKELVRETRRLFGFEYLTCEFYGGNRCYVISFWNGKPEWRDVSWWCCDKCDLIGDIKLYKSAELDLSEYRDADGIIDYSKCIVEVE